MSRPRVSEINMDRIQKYSGDSFDDKLGVLLTITSMQSRDVESLADKVSECGDAVRLTAKNLEKQRQKTSEWKITAILTGIGLVCAFGYIGWML